MSKAVCECKAVGLQVVNGGPMCLLEEACVWVWDVGTGLMGYVFMAVLQVSNTDP